MVLDELDDIMLSNFDERNSLYLLSEEIYGNQNKRMALD
jgi:hypothetical protein